MVPVRGFPAGSLSGEEASIDVGRRELFTRQRGAGRPFNSYGRNDNILGDGGGEKSRRTRRVLSRSAASLKRTIFPPALQFAGTEDERHEAWWRIPFKQTFRDDSRERDGRSFLFLLVDRSLVISIAPALRLSSKCRSASSPKRAKRQNFSSHSGDDNRERVGLSLVAFLLSSLQSPRPTFFLDSFPSARIRVCLS